MRVTFDSLVERVDAARLRDLTLELVAIPSPTGATADVARIYAQRLAEAGATVEILDDKFATTPTVVARLRGGEPGPTVVLNGHLDTVPIPHHPARVNGDLIYGRGSADMKGAMACAAEAVRILAGQRFPGEVAVVAIGLHEAPGGRGEDLSDLLFERGFQADAAIVCEMGGGTLPVAHMGMATFQIEVSREGIPTHELETSPGTPHPLLTSGRVIRAIESRTAELAAVVHDWVGSETYFLGEAHGGDFYNRFPVRCCLVGTRRWAPGRSFAGIESELRALLEPIAAETGCRVDLNLQLVRDAYRIEPSHPLPGALRAAYRDVTGAELELCGLKTVADGAIWQAAGIPAVYHGPAGQGAHADIETIPVAELVRATRVYLLTLARLFHKGLAV